MATLNDLSQRALPIIERYAGKILAGAIRTSVANSLLAAGKSIADCSNDDFVAAALPGIRIYVQRDAAAQCERELVEALQLDGPAAAAEALVPTASSRFVQTVVIESEADVVRARGDARKLCGRLSYGTTDIVRCCTVVSELARNIVQYAGKGTLELREVGRPSRSIGIVATDTGPGIVNVEAILRGTYTSKTGMGRGLIGSRAILEDFEIKTRIGHGTTVRGVFRAR